MNQSYQDHTWDEEAKTNLNTRTLNKIILSGMNDPSKDKFDYTGINKKSYVLIFSYKCHASCIIWINKKYTHLHAISPS